MYSVATLIIPIDYGCNIDEAIREYNSRVNHRLHRLDARILRILSMQSRPMQAMHLRNAAKDKKNIFSAHFNQAINRLIELKYVVRNPWRKYIYYSITMKGRTALDEINQSLVKIVEEQFKKE